MLDFPFFIDFLLQTLIPSKIKPWYNLDGKIKNTLTFKLQNVDVPKALVIQKLKS